MTPRPQTADPDLSCGKLITRSLLATAFLALMHWSILLGLTRYGYYLGVLTPQQVAPFHAYWRLDFSLWLVPALVVLTLYFLLFRRLFVSPHVSSALVILVAMFLFMAIAMSVAMIDGFWEIRGQRLPAVIAPYSRTGSEYLGDAARVDGAGGPRFFLLKFPQPRFFAKLARHSKTHPPGGVLFLWLVGKIFGSSLWAAALVSIFFTSVLVFAVYGLARELSGERVARLAVALLLVTPNVVLFTATSMDGVFSVLPVMSAFLLHRALNRWKTGVGWLWAMLAGLCFALASFMTYAVVCLPILWSVWIGLLAVRDRARFGATLRALIVAALTVIAFYGVLRLIGYDLAAAVGASLRHDASMMGTGRESLAHYLRISAVNLAAFLGGVGLPLCVVWFHEIVAAARGKWRDALSETCLTAFPIALVIIAGSTLFTLEVERVWLFLAPFLLISAARRVSAAQNGRGALAFCLAGLLALQTLMAEIFIRTDW